MRPSKAVVAAIVLATAMASAACGSSSYNSGAATAVSRDTPTARPATSQVVATPSEACSPPPANAAPTADNIFCADPSTMPRAVVLDIIDGDTLDALVDGAEERIRLFGVDTPERGEPCYREATDALAQLAAGEIRLVRDARNRDSNGRLLRYVYTPEGLSIDAVLVRSGLALAWTRDGALRDALVELEARARAAGQGCLWD